MDGTVAAERAETPWKTARRRLRPAKPIVRLVDLKRRFGQTAALDGVSLDVNRGEILGIIGRRAPASRR